MSDLFDDASWPDQFFSKEDQVKLVFSKRFLSDLTRRASQRLSGFQGDAEDAVQKTVVRVMQKWDTIPRHRNRHATIHGFLGNACHEFCRRRKTSLRQTGEYRRRGRLGSRRRNHRHGRLARNEGAALPGNQPVPRPSGLQEVHPLSPGLSPQYGRRGKHAQDQPDDSLQILERN